MANVFMKSIPAAILLVFSVTANALVLEGDYLKLTVAQSGALIDGTGIGLKYAPHGDRNFGSVDFLQPGTPFAFYAIGVNGSTGVANTYGNPFNTTTVDQSAGGTLLAVTNGEYGALQIEQKLSFSTDSNKVKFDIRLKNAGETDLNNIVYAFGIDPDQDVNIGGSYSTVNTVHGQGASASVEAWASASNYTVSLNNLGSSGDAFASVSRGWSTNPYELAVGSASLNGDYTINLAYSFATLAAGAETGFSYEMAVSGVPEPETYALFGVGLAAMALARRRASKV